MKILIAVEGTRGDVHPMLALGRSLIAAGHYVRICAPPDFTREAGESGLEFRPLGRSVREFLSEAAAALHSRGPLFMREMNRWGKESVENQFRVLPEAAAGMDRLVAAGTILAAASAAELEGIPFRFVMYTPAMMPSAEYSPALLPFQVGPRWANRVLWRTVYKSLDWIVGRELNRLRRPLGLPPVSDLPRQLLSARPILATDRHLAPVPEDCPFEYDQIRCLHPLDGEALPAKLESFLASGPPPVYLGFGSMTDPDPARTTRELLDAISRLGCRALISRGWAGIGEGALPEGVMAIDPVAHASLFPRLAAVVHHGGAGTTHSAARAGVPQIIVPHVLDQFYFARRVSALGVGPPPLPRTRLTPRRLAELLEATMGNELLSERAGELRERLAQLGTVEMDPALVVGDVADG